MTLDCPEYPEMVIMYANYGRTADDAEVCPYGQEHNNEQACFSNRPVRVLYLIFGLITSRIHSLRVGNVFSCVCVFKVGDLQV